MEFSSLTAENFRKNQNLPLSQVIASGPGLEKNGVVANKMTEFTVDTKACGSPAPTHVSCMDVDYKPVDVQVCFLCV